jgi:hypothetical protein
VDSKIIVRAEEDVACPKCAHHFPLHEGIARQTIERYATEFEESAREFRKQISVQLENEAERKARSAFTSKITELQDQLAQAKRGERETQERVERDRQTAVERATADAAQQLKALEEDLKRRAEELSRMRDTEIQLRRERQELEDLRANQELELVRRLTEERSKVADQVAQRADERHRLAEAEYRKKLDDVQRVNDELRRKLEQGSQQLQGEVLELHVEQSLTTSFLHDQIEEVKKGLRGADVIQTVRTPLGAVAGKIIWEAKRAESWSDRWLQKLKDDQQEARADLAVLVTTAMPRGIDVPFALVGDVWVVSPAVLRPMAETLRIILLEGHKLRQAHTGKAEKVELLYNYLASPNFSQRVRTMLESMRTMQQDLDAEKRAMTKIWSRRQAQIERVTASMATVVGEIQAISEDSVPGLDALEALQLPDADLV